jgi:hypothetical protein
MRVSRSDWRRDVWRLVAWSRCNASRLHRGRHADEHLCSSSVSSTDGDPNLTGADGNRCGADEEAAHVGDRPCKWEWRRCRKGRTAIGRDVEHLTGQIPVGRSEWKARAIDEAHDQSGRARGEITIRQEREGSSRSCLASGGPRIGATLPTGGIRTLTWARRCATTASGHGHECGKRGNTQQMLHALTVAHDSEGRRTI